MVKSGFLRNVEGQIMTMNTLKLTEFSNNDKQIRALINDVSESLMKNNRFHVPGLGTFSTCTRKPTSDRAACKATMFRACAELRDYASGGPVPVVTGSHTKVVQLIIEAMQSEVGVDIPGFGCMAVVPVSGKNPKLIFHASKEFNGALGV